MRKLLLIGLTTFALALLAGGYVFAAGCCGSGGETQPPAENLLHLTGTVVSLTADGAALVDTGTARVYVVTHRLPNEDGTLPPLSYKVGDRIQVAGLLMALSVEPATGVQTPPANTQIRQATFKVENILCGMCSQSVQKTLQATLGVTQVTVTEEGIATVLYDSSKTTVESLAKAIAHAKHPHGMVFKATLLQ